MGKEVTHTIALGDMRADAGWAGKAEKDQAYKPFAILVILASALVGYLLASAVI